MGEGSRVKLKKIEDKVSENEKNGNKSYVMRFMNFCHKMNFRISGGSEEMVEKLHLAFHVLSYMQGLKAQSSSQK